MLTSSTIEDYIRDYRPVWAFELPKEFFPKEILIAEEHPFFRLAYSQSSYDTRDFMSYAEMNPNRDWGERLPLAVGLSLIDNEAKARKNLKLPMFRQYKGIIALTLQAADGVAKQTGAHRSHYTWWRTQSFQMSNLQMCSL